MLANDVLQEPAAPRRVDIRRGDTSTSTSTPDSPLAGSSKGLLTCFRERFGAASRGGGGKHADLQAPTLRHATLARVVAHGAQHSQLFMPL
jgi:hypothetical protein